MIFCLFVNLNFHLNYLEISTPHILLMALLDLPNILRPLKNPNPIPPPHNPPKHNPTRQIQNSPDGLPFQTNIDIHAERQQRDLDAVDELPHLQLAKFFH